MVSYCKFSKEALSAELATKNVLFVLLNWSVCLEMIRCHVHLQSIPEVLRQYCHAGEDIRHASFHRIVVSTCSSAGMFYQIGLR